MLNKDQSQQVGNGATAIQAGGGVTVVNVGVTISEARQIALDVAKATFYELTGKAKDTASFRVEEITDQVIKKLEKDFPAGLQKATDPDFQYALFTVQKEYARTGDKDLGDLLVDLLVDRSKQDQRDMLQIVLNESLVTAPKLTDSHLAALGVIFLFKYTTNHGIGNHEMLGQYLDRHIQPLLPKLSTSQSDYQHMEFTGCGSILIGDPLERILGRSYQGLFLKGFESSEIASRAISVDVVSKFFVRCLNNENKLQVKAVNESGLNDLLNKEEVSDNDKFNILELFGFDKIGEVDIKEKIISIRPYMADLFEIWNDSSMQSFNLTTVGIAIGHANIKRVVGEFGPLRIWIK
jgi:hypothetical protein